MGEIEKDKKILEELDRMFESRNTAEDAPYDEDTRSVMDIARKIADLSENPSDEFKEDLKARLVHRLSEQEKKTEPEDTELNYWGVSRRKRWQGTIAALITVVVVAVILAIVLILTGNNG